MASTIAAGDGTFAADASCTLAATAMSGVAACEVSYTSGVPTAAGTITAAYGGDGVHGPCSAAITLKVQAKAKPQPPTVTGFRMTRARFAVGGGATGARKSTYPRGTTFEFTLSEPATATIVIRRRAVGHRHGRTCVTGRRSQRPPCTQLLVVGKLTRSSHPGLNRVAFTGRIDSRALGAGAYVATVIAADSAQQTSVPRLTRFTVVTASVHPGVSSGGGGGSPPSSPPPPKLTVRHPDLGTVPQCSSASRGRHVHADPVLALDGRIVTAKAPSSSDRSKQDDDRPSLLSPRGRGATVVADLPAHVDAFVAERQRRTRPRDARFLKEVRGPFEQLPRLAVPRFVGADARAPR